jgi:hypothetical protein
MDTTASITQGYENTERKEIAKKQGQNQHKKRMRKIYIRYE